MSSGYGFSRRGEVDEAAIQSAHSGFVPRVGGLAIYISILVLIPLLSFGFIPLSVVFDLDAGQLTLLILSTVPVFAVGLAEDLGYDMSPKARLIGSAASSLVAILLFKIWIDRLGIPGVDKLLVLRLSVYFSLSLLRLELLTPLTLLTASMVYPAMWRFLLHSQCQPLLFKLEIHRSQYFLFCSLPQSWDLWS